MIIRFFKTTLPLVLIFCVCQIAAQNESKPKVLIVGESNNQVAKDITMTGSVLDAASNSTIPGAVLKLKASNFHAVTDEEGKYILKIPVGKYELEVSFLGYETYTVSLHVIGDGEADFYLEETSVSLNAITVREKRENDNITSVLPGVEQMSIEQISLKSKFLGETDVMRSLQSISGVTSAGEGASGLNVRGGNVDENLIFQDGNLIMNPMHALGFFSLFHPDLVNEVTLYKGGVPAKYGGRLSSVLDVRLREGNNKKFSGQGGVGISSSRLALEGPILKNKISFIVGGRISYVDWILKQVKNVDLNKSQAFFYDVTAKVDARVTKNTKIGFSTFASHDDFQFSNEVKFDYETTTGSFYVNQLIGEKVNLKAMVNIGKYTTSLFDITGNDQSRFDNQINYLRGSLGSFFQVTKNYQLELGVEQNRYEVAPGELEPLNEFSSIKADVLEKEKGYETAFYIHNQFSLGAKIEIIAGLRYTNYKSVGPQEVFIYEPGVPKTELTILDTIQFSDNELITDYSGFGPRLSLRWLINDENSVKLNYNRSFQFFSQISNTASATPIDIWQLSNYHIQPQSANNYSVGYYRNFKENTIRTQFSAFYRTIDNLIDYKDFAVLLLNDHIETELLTGIGKAYGLEFTVNKDYGRHRFEANYTYSRSLRKIEATATQESVNNGEWYPSNYDKPHVFNFNYLFLIGVKSNLSFNFTYSTGRPTTAPISVYSNGNILSVPIYSERNQFRIPDFHRLDVAYTIGPWGKSPKWQNSLTLSIYNLYFRKNAFSVFFRQLPSQSIAAYRVAVLGTIFPAITYNFKF